MKKFLSVIISIILCMTIIFGLTACDNFNISHEHAFSNAWEVNSISHWHKSTCGHQNLFSDLGEHSFGEDGKCSVCGYLNPDFVPSQDQKEDLYYLPLCATEYLDEVLIDKTEYFYSDDLLSFTETRFDYDDDLKRITTYSFNQDYSKLTKIITEYEVDGEEEKITYQDKYEYEFYENSSYIENSYYYDIDQEELVFNSTSARFYNENNQEVFRYSKYPTEDGNFYYSYVYLYEYDENGNVIKQTCFDGSYNGEKITYLDYFCIYDYAEDGLSFTETDYLHSENGYYVVDYAENTVEYIDGIRYVTQQIYNGDGSLGNKNKMGYDENFERVYANYGGIPSEEGIEKNEFNQIISYFVNAPIMQIEAEMTYAENGGNIISSFKTTNFGNGDNNYSTTYTYNEFDQIEEVTEEISGIENATLKTTIEYTEIKKDKLLEFVEIFDSILKNYTDNVLIDGII